MLLCRYVIIIICCSSSYLLVTYVNILCNWLILWQNALYLYLGRSRMCLILQETSFQVQVLKPYKFVQDSSEKSVYEDQFFRTVFHSIHDCMFELSFLTTLDIQKDYFKGCQRWNKLHKCWAKFVQANCDRKQNLP